jgi:hypothetical protein
MAGGLDGWRAGWTDGWLGGGSGQVVCVAGKIRVMGVGGSVESVSIAMLVDTAQQDGLSTRIIHNAALSQLAAQAVDTTRAYSAVLGLRLPCSSGEALSGRSAGGIRAWTCGG